MTRIVCVSDTHGELDQVSVPEGDILVHAGDMSMEGSLDEIAAAHAQIVSLPHRHKVVIAGNHDFAFQRTPAEARALMTGVTYLEDEAAVVMGLKFWGSPWQPWFHDWAFNLPRGEALAEKWARIPGDTDVLITHGPPMGWLDLTARGEHVGCEELLLHLHRVNPLLHVFGHIHEAHGTAMLGRTRLVNASACDLGYDANLAPFVVDLP